MATDQAYLDILEEYQKILEKENSLMGTPEYIQIGILFVLVITMYFAARQAHNNRKAASSSLLRETIVSFKEFRVRESSKFALLDHDRLNVSLDQPESDNFVFFVKLCDELNTICFFVSRKHVNAKEIRGLTHGYWILKVLTHPSFHGVMQEIEANDREIAQTHQTIDRLGFQYLKKHGYKIVGLSKPKS